MCAGQPSGCESAIHALRLIFDDPTTQAALLVDASNAFNNLNRHLTLANFHLFVHELSLIHIAMLLSCSLVVKLFYHRREQHRETRLQWPCTLQLCERTGCLNCQIALSQPHAACSAVTLGLLGRWIFLSRTLPDIGGRLAPIMPA